MAADLSTILKYAMSVGNKSGAIPAAPQGMLKLKESIQGLPFQLLTKGMSGILDQGKILQGIQQLAAQMGGLQNLGGQFQQILGQMASGQVTVDQLVQAAGGVTSMTAGLNTFLSQADQNIISAISPGTATQFAPAATTSQAATPSGTGSINGLVIPGPQGPQGPQGLAANVVNFVTADQFTANLTNYVNTTQLSANLVNYAPLYGLMHNNIIINGGMEVDQIHAGTSTALGAAAYQIDQWLTTKSGTMVGTAQRVADAPPNYNSSLKLTISTAEASLGAGDYTFLYQAIEGIRTSKLAFGTASAQPVTIGFWSKTHRTGLYSGKVGNDAATRSYVFVWTQNAVDTWQFNTIVIPGDTGGSWQGQTTTLAMTLVFTMASGTTFSGTANTWQTGNFIAATGAINGVAATTDTFQITGVVMIPGAFALPQAVAPNFVRSLDEELTLCKRYFQMSYDYGTAIGTAIQAGSCFQFVSPAGSVPAGGNAIRFGVGMRATPTMTAYSTRTGAAGFIGNDGQATDIAASLDANGNQGFRWYGQTTTGTSLNFTMHWTANAQI